MRRLSVVAAVMALTASACGGGGGTGGASPTAGGSVGGPTGSGPGTGAVSTGPPGTSGVGLTYDVWFARHGALFVSSRTQTPTLAVARAALTAMLAGPSDAEAGARSEERRVGKEGRSRGAAQG